jgi:hypothetical protein
VKTVKLDLRRKYKGLYSPPADKVQVVEVPGLRFLMADGVGDPNSKAFQEAVQTLYGLAYTTKFRLKKEGMDYPVMALEGLWWTGKAAGVFDLQARDKWKWTLMIMQPDFVKPANVEASSRDMRARGKPAGEYRLEEFREGLAAQVMHVGPYSAERSTIEKMWSFIEAGGYSANGKHHEIYLGDPRRSAPSKLRTILRQPIKRAG